MKKKRTVAVMTVILVTAFALSSVGVGLIPSDSQKDEPLILNKSQVVLTEKQFQEYSSIFKRSTSPDEENLNTFLIDYKIFVESIKNLGFRAPQLLASQLYASTFGNLDLNNVLARLRVSRETLETFLLDQSLTASVESLFTDVGLLDSWVDKLLRNLLVRFTGHILVFKPQDILVDKPSQDELERYYEENLNRFKEPRKASVSLGAVDLKQVFEKLPYKDEDLEEFYLKNRSKYKEEDKIECENYIFNEKDAGTVQLVNRSNLEEFQKDLERLELKASQQRKIYGETDFKSTFNDSPDANSLYGPAKVSNGLAICLVRSIEQGRTLELMEAKDMLVRDLFISETSKLLQDLYLERSESDQIADFMNEYGLRPEKNMSNVLEEQVLNLSNRNGKMELGIYFFEENDQLKFLAVTDITPERIKSFPEVAETVEAEVISRKQSSALENTLRSIAGDEQVQKDPSKWRDRLADLKYSERTLKDETVADNFILFEVKPAPGIYGPFFGDADATLIVITKVQPHADQIKDSETINSLRVALQRALNLLPLKELALAERANLQVNYEKLAPLN